MSIRRVCSYSATIQTPEAPSNYSAILVTFSQKNSIILNKTLSDLIVGTDTVTVQLDQDETKQFAAGQNAYMQIRCYKSQYEAPGSQVWVISVDPALNETVLS